MYGYCSMFNPPHIWVCDAHVSKQTISHFFLHAFPFRGSMTKPNLVPYDKFRLENVARMHEYVNFIVQFKPSQLKFGDEKSLKGQELFCRRVEVILSLVRSPQSQLPLTSETLIWLLGSAALTEERIQFGIGFGRGATILCHFLTTFLRQ